MATAGIKGYSYCLNHAPELGLHYGNTPYIERKTKGETEFLKELPSFMQTFEEARDYAPNQAYIGGVHLDALEEAPQPWYTNRLSGSSRRGAYGEIMPEDEFLGLMDICDVFDIIWLESSFAADVRKKLAENPVINDAILARLEQGHTAEEIDDEVKNKKALPLYYGGKVVGCTRNGHDVDENLFAHVLMENIASKASSVHSLLHLLKNTGMAPEEVDFVIECSEEAAGDMNQRGGGNFAKAIAEIAGCVNASGCDVRSFCAGPVNGLIAGAAQVASGARQNCVVIAGGAIPKLFMNGRDHVKKKMPALEDCLGSFAVLLVPDDGTNPVMRLDVLGKHTVGVGSSPQAVTTALILDPLERAGLSFMDVDKFAAELHINEITLPAGAGDVPLANIKMTAALAVTKKAIEREDMAAFVKERGVPGFAHTQGHIPSGVPYVGHACDELKAGNMKRVMVIGKGSLFLARLTNLADGASFLIEQPSGKKEGTAAVSKDDIKALLLEVLAELSGKL